MLLAAYALYLIVWWYRIRRHRGPDDAKKAIVARLSDGPALKVVQWVLVALACAVVLSTGCHACVNASDANGYDGWAAFGRTWSELLDGLMWVVIVI